MAGEKPSHSESWSFDNARWEQQNRVPGRELLVTGERLRPDSGRTAQAEEPKTDSERLQQMGTVSIAILVESLRVIQRLRQSGKASDSNLASRKLKDLASDLRLDSVDLELMLEIWNEKGREALLEHLGKGEFMRPIEEVRENLKSLLQTEKVSV